MVMEGWSDISIFSILVADVPMHVAPVGYRCRVPAPSRAPKGAARGPPAVEVERLERLVDVRDWLAFSILSNSLVDVPVHVVPAGFRLRVPVSSRAQHGAARAVEVESLVVENWLDVSILSNALVDVPVHVTPVEFLLRVPVSSWAQHRAARAVEVERLIVGGWLDFSNLSILLVVVPVHVGAPRRVVCAVGSDGTRSSHPLRALASPAGRRPPGTLVAVVDLGRSEV
jgi:hypothetical protein